jgi:hypothetical protein
MELMPSQKLAGTRIDALTRHERPIRHELDVLNRAFAPRQHPLPAPLVSIQAEPTVCLTVNVQWASHILGVLETLNQVDAWLGDDDEKYRATQEIEHLLELFMLGGGCLIDPCCPDTNTALKTINYFMYQQIINNATNTLNYYDLLDDGESAQSFAPGISENFNGDDEDDPSTRAAGDAALCESVREYVEGVCRASLTALEIAEYLATGTAILGGIIAATGIGAVLGAVIAGVGILTRAGLSVLAQAFQDADAKEKVICCMYSGLRGQQISKTSFSNSVADCGFGTGNLEAQLAYYVNDVNHHSGSYHAFTVSLKDRRVTGSTASDGSGCSCTCEGAYVAPYTGELGRQYPTSTVEFMGEVDRGGVLGIQKLWRVRPAGVPVDSVDKNNHWGIRFQIVGQTGDCVFEAHNHADLWRKDTGFIRRTDGTVVEFIGAMAGLLTGCNAIYWQSYYDSYNAQPTPGYDYYVDVYQRLDIVDCPEE